MKFEFATASRIIFGPGILSRVAPMAAEMGRRPLVVTGHSGDRAAPLMDALQEQGLEISWYKFKFTFQPDSARKKKIK